MNARGDSMLDAPTLAAILRDAISELNRDCDLDTSNTAQAVRAGEIVRKAMDRAVNVSAGNPDEDMLLEMWAGSALQGVLAGCPVHTSNNSPDVAYGDAATEAMNYALAMLAEYKRRRS